MVVIDRQPRVLAGEQWGLDGDLHFRAPADHVFARRQGDARQFGAVVSQDDLGLRNVHGRETARTTAPGTSVVSVAFAETAPKAIVREAGSSFTRSRHISAGWTNAQALFA